MSIATLIGFWLFIPAIVIAAKELKWRRLLRCREHDLILYAFCEARDVMAIKALRGEISENSETFRYFYKQLAKIIHDHRNHPIGFAHIAKSLAENKNRPVPTWVRRLIRELKKSDPEIKHVVCKYIQAIDFVRRQDTIIALLEKLPFWWKKTRTGPFRSTVGLSSRTRQFARFNTMLAEVVNYCPQELLSAA